MLKRIAIPALLLFSAQAFGAEMIYAWGDGDSLSKTLTAVKFTFAHGDFEGLFKFVLLIAITMALISTARLGMKSDMLSLPKMFAMSMGISTLFIVWRIDTVVKDVNTNQNYVVDSVPWAVAKPLVWFTGAEKTLGEIMESTFAVPGDLTYSKSGFLSPFAIMDGAANAKIVDPYIFQSVDNFIIDCVAPDISSGYYDITALANSEDLWAEFADTNPARVVYYYDPATRQPQLETCQSAYNLINGNLNTYASGVGMTSLGSMLGGYTGAQISSLLGTSSNYFMGYSKSASSFLLQSIMVNQFSETYKNWATVNGMSNEAVAYGVGKGEQTAQANMVISGALGSKYLPVIKSILTIIIVALTPIVALLLLTPLFWKVLAGYLTTLIWLSLWHVGEVILNFYILNKAASYIQGVTDSNGVYNLVSKPVVDGKYIEYVNMAASMYWMIPTIAGVIVGGFGWMAFQGMTGGMTARVARGEGASMEVGSGEAKLGNITMNNARTNQQNWAANSSFGQGTNMNSSFGIDNGYNENNKNKASTRSLSVGGKTYTGDINYETDGQGNYIISNMSAIGNDGKRYDTKGGKVVMDSSGHLINGTLVASWSDDGKPMSSETTAAGGGMLATSEMLGNGNTLSSNNAGGKLQFKLSNDNGNQVVYAPGYDLRGIKGAVSLGNEATSTEEQVKQENEKLALQKAITAQQSGEKLVGTQAELVAGAKFAASSENSTASERIKATTRSDVVSGTSSTLEAYSQKNDKAFEKAESTKESETRRFANGTKVSAAVESDKALLGKLASALFGAKAGAEASTSLENAWVDEHGVTVTTKDGTTISRDYSQSFKHDVTTSVANSDTFSTKTAHTDKQTRTDEVGASAKKNIGMSYKTGLTEEEKESYTAELSAAYSQKMANNTKLSSESKFLEIMSGFFKEEGAGYKSTQYGNGVEGLMQAWTANDPEAIKRSEEYIRSKAGLATPEPVLDQSTKAAVVKAGGHAQGVSTMPEATAIYETAEKLKNSGMSLPELKGMLSQFSGNIQGAGGGSVSSNSQEAAELLRQINELKASSPEMLKEYISQLNKAADTVYTGSVTNQAFKYPTFDTTGGTSAIVDVLGNNKNNKGTGSTIANPPAR
ncbi:conjugal transfer protein TraG [Sulfuricurvum sp. IAE1]|uniref:conjugal transfer protein TraG N-terminal domain-containing protein n=1 Tax=Sulfuricurvum sp. IAE1 TaxID=2546102 RepID=UPI001043B89A|nr:conjugal transfer protein TraG N-terminal domain-containing protein [Sulfuricurvum sp. IAE1]TDA63630.1 conjugal transfer protein TraG [Sulfuricurvum sp. IAE1]